MQKPGKLQNKRTNIVEFVQERDAIFKGINAGLEDAKAGRVHTHAEVTARIDKKINRSE
jgi:predicted transcriptional regulator